MISGLFDLQIRLDRIDRNGDPLATLDELIDWEQFRPALETLRDKPRKSNAGAKGYDHWGSPSLASRSCQGSQRCV